MSLTNIPHIIKRDSWNSAIEFSVKTRQALQQLGHLRLGTDASPTFEGLTLDGLTASQLVQTDVSKQLTSVSDLTNWVSGTANEIDIADDGDGTITVGIVNPLIVSKGGIGTDTLTNHSLLAGSGTDPITALGVATNGQIPIGSAGADPVLAALTETAKQVLVTNGAGSITLSTPQDIDTDSYPVFINTNTALSPMIMTGGEISEGTNAGTVKVGALTAMLRTTDSETGTLTKVTLAEQDNVALAAADVFYNIILTYGEPCTIATSESSPAGTNAIGIGHCLKEADDTLHYSIAGLRLNDGVRKLHHRASKLRNIEKSSGCAVASTGTRNFTISSGYFYRGINQYSFSEKDTSDTDTFDYFYYNPTTSAWVKEVKDNNGGAHYTALDNVQYNNVEAGTGLANLTVNKYTTNWIFVHPDDEHIIVVYGQINSTLTDAENDDIPANLPPIIDKMGCLLAKVIIRQGSDNLVVENVEYFTFERDITVDHNELAGLQGGQANEYYHLTAAEHTLGAAIMALTPTDSNFIVGDGSTWVAESGATARTSIGLGIADDVQFNNITGVNLTVSSGEVTCGSINRASGDLSLEIGGVSSLDIGVTRNRSNVDFYVASGSIIAGVGDTTRGIITAYGPSAGVYGGTLNLYTGADYDDTIDSYYVRAYEDDLQIGGTAGVAITVAGTTVTYAGDVVITGTATYSSNIIIPDAGWVGSVTTNQAIQIEADGDIVVPGMLAVTGDVQVTGNILLMTDNGGVGYSDNSPMLVFNNTDDQVEVTGKLTVSSTANITGALTAANYTAANLLTACATNAGALDFSAASKMLTVEDDAIVSQDYSSDAAPTFGGLDINGAITHDVTFTTGGHIGLIAVTNFSPTANANYATAAKYVTIHNSAFQVTNHITGLVCQVYQAGSGLVALAKGATFAVVSTGTGNITKAAALMVSSPFFTSTGEITTNYGLWIQDQSNALVGTAYSIYQEGTDDINMFNAPLELKERATAQTSIAGYGQIWVKNTTPNTLWFTDDGGTDHQIAFV